jgi:hypothetical protein
MLEPWSRMARGFASPCLFALFFAAGAISAGGAMMPIAVTGWNRDVIVESTASGPPFTAYATEMNAGENKAFYQTGLPGFPWGLPPSGVFVSMMGDSTIFQFQPYTTSNALILSPDTGLTNGTLTLQTPAVYAQIAILAHAGNGTNTTGPLTINFTDGTTLSTTYFVPDWFNGTTNVAWFGPGRILLSTGADDGGPENPRWYQTTVNVAALTGATNKPIASLTFGKSSAKSDAIYAVSGQAPTAGGPIAVNGWNRDVVVENTASGPPYSSYAVELNPGEGNAFYQAGLPGKSYGLPANGAFQSAADGVLFQLQPYTGSNALVMSSATGITRGTLTLSSPAIYNSLSVAANSASGGGTPTITLNFADGSTLVTNYNAQDWFNNNGSALAGMERISLSGGATQGAPNNPRFYQTTLDLVALFGPTNKTLTSVSFDQAVGAGATAVYAISGIAGNQTNAYSIATITNAPATGLGTRTASIGGGIASTGGSGPEVFLFYGTSDGSTNAANWSNRVYAGAQNGGFARNLTGLSPNTTYFFRWVGINAAGVSWANSSISFTTVAASLTVVTNLPAANVTTTSALLSGQVLSTGSDAPGITIYYGPSNGGNNPAAWAHGQFAGTQVARFAQIVTGLTANATNYFTSAGTNAAGTAWAGTVLSFVTPATNPPPTPVLPVLTWHVDNARTGQNTNETVLTPADVNTNTFGKLFSYTLDGYMPAQPLILPNVTVPGQGTRNLVFAVTEHDSIYAFDADDGGTGAPLWHVSLINSSAGVYTLSPGTDLASFTTGFDGSDLGITSTPVIDPITGTIYVVAMTKEAVNNVTNFYNRLHALDVATGAEKFGGPVLIQGTVPGVGDGHDANGNVPFMQLQHHNREALLLNNGMVYIAFTGHFDIPPYHGWVFAYDAHTLAQTGMFNANANGSGGGFWQAGCGPAVDIAGNLYLESGNGNFDAPNNVYGNTVLKLSTTNGLALADYFTPYNQLDLNLQDIDVGSAGQVVLPDSVGSVAHPHLLVAGSKAGAVYLLDRDNMGHYSGNGSSDPQIVQTLSGVSGQWSTAGYFNGKLYFVGNGDFLKMFSITNAAISTSPIAQSGTKISFPGASPVISANGTSNAIVWVLQTSGSPNNNAVLHAYDANNVTNELYNSAQNAARDAAGNSVKFAVPAVVNGKVYVPAINSLTVYGSSTFLPAPSFSPNGGVFTNSLAVSLSNSFPGTTIYYTLDGSTPTTNSILYTGPMTISSTICIRAVAALPGSPNSAVAAATFYNSAEIGRGTGLIGQYYNNTFPTNPFAGSPLVRTDAVVNFNWNSSPPDPSMYTTNYTVRWIGMVQPLFSENYTFSTTTDDGIRLWVNGQLIIDHWAPQSPTAWSGSVPLQAGLLYSIEMDYFQAQGGAVAQLSWSSPSTVQVIVPQSQLYPITALPPVFFTGPAYFSNGQFSLQATGMAGGSYIFQGTTDFVHWTSLSTNLAPANLFNLIDATATNFPYRFYRAILQP